VSIAHGNRMRAWLDAETDEEADEKWLTLTNALSGLFCASLNFIESPGGGLGMGLSRLG